MFMELLKTKSKIINLFSIRAKYNISDELGDEEETSTESFQASFNDTLKQDDEPDLPTVTSQNESFSLVLQSDKTSIKAVVVEETASKDFQGPAPVLLNPTIHVKIRNIQRIELFNCDLCSHTSSTKFSMERHMKQIHLKQSAIAFRCETCFKTFAKKALLQNHQKIHMTHRPTYDCQHCGKVLSSKTAVASHIKWLHKDKRDYRCTSCPKMFVTVSLS